MEQDNHRTDQTTTYKNDYTGVIIGVVLFILLLLVLFGTGWGAMLLNGAGLGNTTTSTTDNRLGSNKSGQMTQTNEVTTPTDANTATAQNPDDVAFRINTSTLSEEQRTMLRTVGITGENIEITNAMKLCAETSIGVSRTGEIASGAAPSIMEATKLMGCYNS